MLAERCCFVRAGRSGVLSLLAFAVFGRLCVWRVRRVSAAPCENEAAEDAETDVDEKLADAAVSDAWLDLRSHQASARTSAERQSEGLKLKSGRNCQPFEAAKEIKVERIK